MTFKEADEAARECRVIMHDGAAYDRITEIGYEYDHRGRRAEFVTLIDGRRNLVRCRASTVEVFDSQKFLEAKIAEEQKGA